MIRCIICKFEKDDSCFRSNGFNKKTNASYLRKQCKLCESIKQKKYRLENITYYSDYNKQYKIIKNKDLAKYNIQYNQDHTKEKSIYNCKYFQDNKIKISQYQNKYKKNKRIISPQFKLRCNLSIMIAKSFKRNNLSKNNQTISQYLFYTIQDLKLYLESKFESWMTWENYGRYNSKTWNDQDASTWTWNIDHIIPQSTFNYISIQDENFKKCWSLDNLRPYSAKQNILDGNRQ